MHKWDWHAKTYLLREIGLYILSTCLLPTDLVIIGHSMANNSNSGFSGALFGGPEPTRRGRNVTANGLLNFSVSGLASSCCEVLILALTLRGFRYAV